MWVNKENESEVIQRWALHKRNPVVAAGLNRNCGSIPQADWDELSRTSNAVEQAANKSYAFGKRLPLLIATHM